MAESTWWMLCDDETFVSDSWDRKYHVFPDSQELTMRINITKNRETHDESLDKPLEEEKERCSGSYRLAVGFLVIKDESISERPG